MMLFKKRLIFILLLFILPCMAIAQANIDIKKATKELNTLNSAYQSKNLTLEQAEEYSDKLNTLYNQAQKCIEQSKLQTGALREIVKSKQDEALPVEEQADYKYLKEKYVYYMSQLSACQFLLYKIDESREDHNLILQKLASEKVFERSIPLWDINKSRVISDFNEHKVFSTAIDKIKNELTLPSLLIGIGTIVLFILIRIIASRALKYVSNKNNKSYMPILNMLVPSLIFPIAFFGLLSGFLYVQQISNPGSVLFYISNILVIYFIAMILIKFVLCPKKNIKSPIKIHAKHGVKLYRSIRLFVIWVALAYLIKLMFTQTDFSDDFVDAIRIGYVTILSILIFFVLKTSLNIMRLSHSIKIILWCILLALLTLALLVEYAGYHSLAVYVLSGMIGTILTVTIASFIYFITESASSLLLDENNPIGKYVKNLLSVRTRKTLYEVYLLKYTLYFIVIYVAMIALMHSWDMSVLLIDKVIFVFFNGFHLGSVKIVPVLVIYAMLVFSALHLLGRFISSAVTKKHRYTVESDVQIAVSSIISYITFSVSFILALLIIGVNFTGLAIIAGALSVGIGLGLQDIVNNFFSGLILLLEKPIRPGDRIVIGDTEGFVKRVRLRSTQVHTLSREDIIIPNTELINNKVTNFMYRDKNCRIVLQVGVAYGSDIDKVKDCLLKVAKAHENILQSGGNQPQVLFRQFGDSSLIFELWCIVHDVNQKFIISSELNFSIDKIFRENNIVIAFPQCDIHIKK